MKCLSLAISGQYGGTLRTDPSNLVSESLKDPNAIGYLGFQWTFNNGRHRFFVFNVLPFGAKLRQPYFHERFETVGRKMEGEVTKAILYIDDGINGRSSYKEAEIAGEGLLMTCARPVSYVMKQSANGNPRSRADGWV